MRTISIERRGCSFSPMQRQMTLGKLMRGYASFLNRKILLRESRQASANLSQETPFRSMCAESVSEKELGSCCRMDATFRDRFASSIAGRLLPTMKVSASTLYRSIPYCIPRFFMSDCKSQAAPRYMSFGVLSQTKQPNHVPIDILLLSEHKTVVDIRVAAS